MARLEFRLPDIGEGVTEAEIVEWHAAPGDAVKEGQTVVAVMTDKATVEMEAPADGIVLERCGEVGAMLPVGALLFALETGAEPEAAPPSPGLPEPAAPPPSVSAAPAVGAPSPTPGSSSVSDKEPRVLAAPAVRQRARALGIDLASVPTATDHVRHEDLDRFLMARATPPPAAVPASGLAGEDLPLTGLRRQIARRMQEAHQRIPHFTYVEELDLTALEQRRAALNRAAGERTPLHLLPFLVAALCRALREFPLLNAHYDDAREVLTRFDAINVGIATQTGAGLVVPVLRDAEGMDLWQTAEGIARLASRARSGEIAAAELRGSTITITSLGKLGGIAATPIINRPEVAILAPHRIIERAVPMGGGLETRKLMNLSISCDHRVIDGHVAAAFVASIRQTLETADFQA